MRRLFGSLLRGAIKPVVGLGLAGLFGWTASALMGEPGHRTVYSEAKPGAAVFLTVAVASPGRPVPAERLRTVPFAELDAFLKKNPQYQLRLPAGSTCWPVPPSPEGTKTCVDAEEPVNGEQQIEVRESFGGDRDSYSIYKVSTAGVTPVSYYTVHGMLVTGFALGICVAGVFGLLLGMKLGERVQGIWSVTQLKTPHEAEQVTKAEAEWAAKAQTAHPPKYVGFWKRVIAALIDILIIIVVTVPLLLAIYGTGYFARAEQSHGYAGWWDFLIQVVLPAVGVILFWNYRGATPGKIAISAKIVDATTGGAPSPSQFVGRYFAYIVSILPLFLGLIWVAFDRRKQGLHDKLANTVVIYDQHD